MRISMSRMIGILVVCFFGFNTVSYAELDTVLSVDVKDSPLKGVLELIAAKAGLQLVVGQDPGGMVSVNQSEITAKQLLDKLAIEQEIEYTITDSQLIVTKRSSVSPLGDSHMIQLHYALANEVALKLKPLIARDEKIIFDEHENKIIFMGSSRNFEKVQKIVTMFDAVPKQIQIEAVIVETSHNFMRQLGVSMQGLGDSTNTSGPSDPNGNFKTMIGSINSKTLDIRLTAAESNGDAKVVSRPKVMTMNNKIAKVQSGITYHIKTLSSVQNGQTGSSTTPGVLTGGLTSVDAGLNLDILPTLVSDDDIKLNVDINNSSPDQGSAVDGIPGILKNSANTTVVVKNKQTVVIAGLIKQSKSANDTGVPFLSSIPLIGLLFKSHAVSDQLNELVIFLTPTIGNPENTKVEPYLTKGEIKIPVENFPRDRAPASEAAPSPKPEK